jgi:hypothetical protein
MKRIATFALVTAISLAGAAQAQNFGAKLTQAYTAAGYENVTVTHAHGQWSVTATKAGVTQSFTVDRKTGHAAPAKASTKSRHGGADDGAGHDLNDDNGAGHHSGADDGAGHDLNDDNGAGHHSGGDDGAGHDAGDDHGGNGGEAGDDHGGHGGGHSGSDD